MCVRVLGAYALCVRAWVLRRTRTRRSVVQFDTSGSRTLTLFEFALFVTHLEREKMREAFNMYDRDGSGDIDAKELRGALKYLGLNLGNIAGVDALVNGYDGSGDASLDFDDFCMLVADVRRLQHGGAVSGKDKGAAKGAAKGDVDVGSLLAAKEARDIKQSEEDEYDEDGNRKPKSAFGWLGMAMMGLLTVLMDFVLDALSGGSCMFLMPALFSAGFYVWNSLVSFVTRELVYGDNPAPPAPPVAPALAAVAVESLFDYAERHPLTYLLLNYGIISAIGAPHF